MVSTTSITDSKQQKTYSYDETPYESYPFPQSHPDHLAALATVFGMKPQPVNKARIMELGCASGGNLIPAAYSFPESQFVGIELSERQVADGTRLIEALGLKNIEIKHINMMDMQKDFGTFDYIITHGVYSWVPDNVQEKMLQIMQDCLAPNGVAYISYNTYPGWHFRGMIRDMMLYHTAQFPDPQSKVAQARALLDFLHQSVPVENNAYGIMLKNELDLLRMQKDYYLLHDHLEEENRPVYFHQFVERAGSHNLQYLGESDFSTMLTMNFPRELQETLSRVTNDILRTEQYLDFVRNRTFRQTLLCHKDVPLNRNLTPESIMPLHVACPARPETAKFDPMSRMAEKFTLPDGRFLTTEALLIRAAFHHLSSIWPQSISFDELNGIARGMVSNLQIVDPASLERDKQALAGDILKCYAANLVVLRSHRLPFVREISERPKASDLVRNQVERQLFTVTNQLHEAVNIDILAAHMIKLMDGTRDRAALLDDAVKLAKSGVLIIQKDGKPVSDDATLRQVLEQEINGRLEIMTRTAVLVG